ncbi:HDOD domain-containing protein [Aquabacterium sp.]|uniref:HDOD domain-containing protein n=1 Tax=Aquabacterium sp. TaxID=1872578 RepID=UPI003BB0DFC1
MPVSPPTPSPSVDNEAHLTLDYLLRRMRFKSDFPALATSITRIQALSGSESESLHTLCDEILKDVALTQKLLRVVNTAHYRRAGTDPISTVSRAVSLIGLAGVRNLALSLMLLEHMEDKVHAQQLKVEFLRTVMAGTLASELSHQSRDAEEAFLGALFRNLGRLLVAFYLPEDAEQIRTLTTVSEEQPGPLSDAQASVKVLGVSHEQLAGHIGQSWGLPDGLLACMRSPEGRVPTRSLAARPERLWWLASMANEVAQTMLDTEPVKLGDALTKLARTYAPPLDLTSDDVSQAAARARKRLTELTQALNLNVPAQSPGERLLDTYYVDAPNSGQTDGPTPDALGLGDDTGTLAPDLPPLAVDATSILTNGIQDITNSLVESFRLNDVLQMILETMLRALNCRRVVFCLRDARTGQLTGRLGLGEGADVVRDLFTVPLVLRPGENPELFTAVCLKQVDTLIADASAPNIVTRLPTWFRDRVQAPTFLVLPLVMKRTGQADMVLGLIYADKGQADSLQISEKELSLLRTLRNQAVMAFRHAANG